MASTLINALAPHVLDTVRMGVRWAGPRVATASVKFVEASHAAREFVRDLAEKNFEALTESEYLEATNAHQATSLKAFAPDLTDLDNDHLKGMVQSADDGNEQDACMEPRNIILHCRNIRASRNLGQIEVIGGLIPQLSHWCVEVNGLFCELRANNGDKSPAFVKNDGRIILHSELGERDRKISLEITTHRRMHDSTKSYEVGTTVLSPEQIIKIASLIFRRFAQSYDLLIDNCQLFSQLLAETIGGKENSKRVRSILSEKSVMRLPIAASWLVGPAYHFMAVVHHALPTVSSTHRCPPDGFCVDCPVQSLQQSIDHLVENWEKFYYHPRVYGSREKTKENIEAIFESLNPFS